MPDLKKQLMIMFDVFIASSIFLIASFIAGIANISLNISLALILILQLIVLQQVYKRFCFKNGDRNKKIIMAVLIYIIATPLIYIIVRGNIVLLIFYHIFFTISLFLTRSNRIEIFTYDEYVFRVKLWNIINACFIIGISFLNESIKDKCMIVLMEGIIISIVILRKSRNYDNGLKNQNDKWFNLSVITLTTLSFTPWFNNLCQSIGAFIKNILEKTFDVINMALGTPIFYVMEKIRQFLKPHQSANPQENGALVMDKAEEILVNENKTLDLIVEVLKNVGKALVILGIIIILFCLVHLLIKAIKRSVNSEKRTRETLEEYCEIEKIENTKRKKEKFKFYIEGNSNKSKIRRIYARFLNLAREKKVYKPSSTPTAISNQMKTNVNASKELDLISNIYNESKFSEHEITNVMVDSMDKAYKTVQAKSTKKF